ncbi:GNAT family N-acetyltransferase [Syntrophomonas curvata]
MGINTKFITATLDMLEGIAAVHTAAFSEREPMTMSVNFTKEEMYDYFLKIIPESIDSGLTIAAVDEDTRAVAGAITCFDAFADFPHIEWTAKEIDGIGRTNAFFEELEKPLNGNPVFKPGKCIRFMYISTDENYLRMGIAENLTAAMINRAVDLGYQLIIVDATNRKSAGNLEKLGFHRENVLSYNEVEKDGVRPFANVEGEGILYSMNLPGGEAK